MVNDTELEKRWKEAEAGQLPYWPSIFQERRRKFARKIIIVTQIHANVMKLLTTLHKISGLSQNMVC